MKYILITLTFILFSCSGTKPVYKNKFDTSQGSYVSNLVIKEEYKVESLKQMRILSVRDEINGDIYDYFLWQFNNKKQGIVFNINESIPLSLESARKILDNLNLMLLDYRNGVKEKHFRLVISNFNQYVLFSGYIDKNNIQLKLDFSYYDKLKDNYEYQSQIEEIKGNTFLSALYQFKASSLETTFEFNETEVLTSLTNLFTKAIGD